MIQKTKHLYGITIDGIIINTQLSYNLKTNHIGIGNSFSYQKEYRNQYRKDNKDKISKQNKEYYENNKKEINNRNKQYYYNNKEKLDEYAKQYHYNNRDPNSSIRGSLEHRIKISCSHRNILIEDFDEFTTDQKYCTKFNNKLRKQIRDKYYNKCFLCDKNENDNLDKFNKSRKLSVHHVDMNKQQGCDDEQWKLIPVCMECHPKLHTKEWQYRIEYLLNK